MEFSMFPISNECVDEASVSKSVAKIINAIDKSGVKYQLTPMGTVVETDTLQAALNIIALAYAEIRSCERIYSSLKLDIRSNSDDRLIQKVQSVQKHIGRKINH